MAFIFNMSVDNSAAGAAASRHYFDVSRLALFSCR